MGLEVVQKMHMDAFVNFSPHSFSRQKDWELLKEATSIFITKNNIE